MYKVIDTQAGGCIGVATTERELIETCNRILRIESMRSQARYKIVNDGKRIGTMKEVLQWRDSKEEIR